MFLAELIAHKLLHRQRSRGALKTGLNARGLARHREEGCLKLRLPQGGSEAIVINTSGGLAGGDFLTTDISVEAGAEFILTSQSAERVYGTLGPSAEVSHHFQVANGAALAWLPQETIMFDGAALHRKMLVELAQGATFLAVEALVLGRTASNENVRQIAHSDHWDIWQGGKLIHAERIGLCGVPPNSAATLGANKAFATVIVISDNVESLKGKLTQIESPGLGISCWNGKLIARLIAEDGFQLRKTLKAVVSACLKGKALPRVWDM